MKDFFFFFTSLKSNSLGVKKIVLFFFILIISVSSVLAIGMSPPDVYADYEEGVTHEYTINIINNAQSISSIQMSAQGEYAEYVEFSETDFKFKRDEVYHPVTIKVTLPDYDDLTSYGVRKIFIRASEGSSSRATGMFSVTTAITGWFVIDIPVPGKYGVIDSFTAKNALEGENAAFELRLKNRGTQELSGTSAKIFVSDYEGNVIDTLNFNNIQIPVEGSYVINDVLPTSTYSSSKYFASVEYSFNIERSPTSKKDSFFVGSTDIELVSYTKNATENKINKINLELQSLWGSPLNSIRGFLILDDSTQPLPVLDFAPFEKKNLQTFIDIPDVNTSTLPATLRFEIPVDDAIIEKEYQLIFDVIEEVEPVSESPISNSSFMLVGIILIVILLVAINVIMYMRRKK